MRTFYEMGNYVSLPQACWYSAQDNVMLFSSVYERWILKSSHYDIYKCW